MKEASRTLCAAAVALLLAAAPVLAEEIGPGAAKEMLARGEILPLKTIVEKAEKLKSGKLLEANLRKKKGVLIYKLEIVGADGVVWELKFDAKTGALIQVEEEE